MAKVTDVIPDAVKERLGAVMEPLSKVEARIKELTDKLPQFSQVKTDQLRKYLDDILKRVKEARANVEKAFYDGIQRTFSLLNLPSKSEIDELKNKVAKIEKDVASLKGAKRRGRAAKVEKVEKTE